MTHRHTDTDINIDMNMDIKIDINVDINIDIDTTDHRPQDMTHRHIDT